MSDHVYQFTVEMSCGGCSGAVNRVLTKTPGVKNVDVNLGKQSVRVITEPYVGIDELRNRIEGAQKVVKDARAIA